MTERIQQLTKRFDEIAIANESLHVMEAEKKVGKFTFSPALVNLDTLALFPEIVENTKNNLTTILDRRNSIETTRQPVHLSSLTVEDMPTSQEDLYDYHPFVKLELDIPDGLNVDQKLLEQLKEFHAREICRRAQGSLDKTTAGNKEKPAFVVERKWDYEPVDKLSNVINGSRRTEYDMDGYETEVYGDDIKFKDPGKSKRRKNPQTGTVVFIGESSDLRTGYFFQKVFKRTDIFLDDVSAVEGIHVHQGRPKKISKTLIEKPFTELPLEIKGCEKTTRITLLFQIGSNAEKTKELDLYYQAILLADILSGRVTYNAKPGDIGSVGINYKNEVSAIWSYLNKSRYKDLDLEHLPGTSGIYEQINEHLIKPLSKGDINKAQNIILAGTPGSGKTALVTAVARESNGVGIVSIDAGQFMRNGERFTQQITNNIRDRYGIDIILAIEDAESLFVDEMHVGSNGHSIPIDPEKRATVLNLLSGEQDPRLKFLLTVNKPKYIDEAARRRFLLIYSGLPNRHDKGAYLAYSEANLKMCAGGNGDPFLISTLAPMIAKEARSLPGFLGLKSSKGYPPAFVGNLTEMVLSHIEAKGVDHNSSKELRLAVKICSRRLKAGYPITEILEQDRMAKKVAGQVKT